ncbi:MAG: DUF5906 domain-containing protein [Plesiomonas shigelloides]
MQCLPPALGALRPFKQFMIYKLVPSATRPGKTDKFPCSLAGDVVSAHDMSHWVDADTACTEATRRGAGWGVAFILSDDDPFFFVDIDDCLLPDRTWSPVAIELCTQFAGAAVEVSQSGRGLHIIGSIDQVPEHGCKNIPLGLECYTGKRFIALTGTSASGDAAARFDTQFDEVVSKYFSADVQPLSPQSWTTTHCDGSFPIDDDDRLIAKALDTTSAASVFTCKASFRDLWERNVSVLADTYPDEVREFDASSADAALAQHLAFWTGNNCERIERLMRRSGLVRSKWDKHKSYVQRTVCNAVARQTSWYSVGAPIELAPVTAVVDVAKPVMRSGYQLVAGTQLVDYFAGCVYIADIHRIFTPGGAMLKSEQFNAMYGGYTFSLDDNNEKTTKKAFEAFTESQYVTFPKVDSFAFRPSCPPGSIIEEEGRRLVNSYVPVEIQMQEGDIEPFMNHLRKVLPDQRDQQILLAYMAACVQYKGYKIQWAPLIQGCEGNGKTLFTRCLAYAIGQRYTHMPPANEISEKFNAWLFDKLFIGVEDIYVPDQKLEVLEILKPMITGTRLARRAMQQDQSMHDVCANFMFNSNHKNAIKKTMNDRRFAVFYSAQQEAADLIRDGMDGNYFPNLYNWLRDGGFACVAYFLHNYQIPAQYNPTTECQRAPDTSTTAEAVEASLGGVEQEILEAIDEGRTGFAGGWVSSFALDKLIERLRADRQIPRTKRRGLMQSLGYDWHPALKDGRVNNTIMDPCGNTGKPRLFIRHGHIHANLTSGAEVARHYAAAQGDPVAMAATQMAQ